MAGDADSHQCVAGRRIDPRIDRDYPGRQRTSVVCREHGHGLAGAQLGRHRKPIVLVNINGFWDPLMTLVQHMAEAGFIHTAHLVKPLVIDKVEDIVPAILRAGRSSREGDAAVLEKM